VTARRLLVHAEGQEDRALLEALRPHLARGEKMDLPRREHWGLRAAVTAAQTNIEVGLPVVVVRDLDDLDVTDVNALKRWTDKQFDVVSTPLSGTTFAVGTVATNAAARRVRVAVVGCGVPDIGSRVAVTEVASFAVDDYALWLAWQDTVYARLENQVPVSATQGRDALPAVVSLLRERKIAITGGKRLAQLFRAIVGFRAAPATFMTALARCAAAEPDWHKWVEPLRTDLDQALDFISGEP